MKKLTHGFGTFFAGIRLWLHDKKLLSLSLIPLLVDVVLIVASLAYAVPRIPSLVSQIINEPGAWYQLIFY